VFWLVDARLVLLSSERFDLERKIVGVDFFDGILSLSKFGH
jgi:hypothetical protein